MLRVALYKSRQSGLPGVYNWMVSKWTLGPYSHCELVFSDGMCGSSSFMDGGVRYERIDFNPDKWDFIELPWANERAARDWFDRHYGQAYDILGNLHFVIGFIRDDDMDWFCSEAVAAALGIPDPWRFDPNRLAAILRFKNQLTLCP